MAEPISSPCKPGRRWGRERYEGAVAALVYILRRMQATRPDACVLRPVLREEARKAIGAARG